MSHATIRLMRDHRSVRDYAADEVPRDDIETAVEAAQCASTSSHVQAYSAILVRHPDDREALAEVSGGQRQVREAGALFVLCVDLRRHMLLSRSRGREHVQNFESFLVGVVDTALFGQNLALAFESLGYGICYIGAIRNDLERVGDVLELPTGVLPLFGLTVGVPRTVPDRKPRLPLEATLMEDRYPSDERMLQLLETYDETMRAYYEGRGAPGRDWTGGIVRRHERPVRDDIDRWFEVHGARIGSAASASDAAPAP